MMRWWCVVVVVGLALSTPVTFTPLDPSVTNPGTFWPSMENPVPEEYCNQPRFPVVPSPGPIAMDVLRQVYPNGTSRPTNTWQKNLWGFEFDDIKNWNGLYTYPYVTLVKSESVSFMYPGHPVNEHDNGRMLYGVVEPPKGLKPSLDNASYPYLTMSAAFDFGLLIKNGQPRLKSAEGLGATVEYIGTGGKPVATLHLLKGSPYVNIECDGAELGFGSQLPGVPPIIQINDLNPGSPIKGSAFKMKEAVGPTHPQGEYWHVYFDTEVSIDYPNPPTRPANLTAPYTGMLQIACGEVGDAMGAWLDHNNGVYATSGEVSYDVDAAGNKAVLSFTWKKGNRVNRTTELVMLALPHHIDVLQGAKTEPTAFWMVKGNMTAVTGTTWSMQYPLTTQGFGDTLAVDPSMKDEVLKAVEFDYNFYVNHCPGDNVTGHGRPGNTNMELYAYVRDLALRTDLAIIAENLGKRDWAVALTKKVLDCMSFVLKRPATPPLPCEPPINNTATCVRDLMDMYYDTTWGGLVTGWYSRFAAHYCECDKGSPTACEGFNYCDNPNGFGPFANYGNAFYNDHHFQYGYIVKNLAWALYFQVQKGAPLGMSSATITNVTKQALAFARDYANPDDKADPFFTAMRVKDLYDGHSWAEGYSYSGRIEAWVNQQSGGEAINSYYAIYLLGLALKDSNVENWGRINLATEMQSLGKYQHLSNRTEVDSYLPYKPVNKMKKCISILIGNGLSGATYYGPNVLFECGITVLPITPVTRDWVNPEWAKEVHGWLVEQMALDGICGYPNPTNMSQNPCPGPHGPSWWGNEWGCCPTDQGFPWNQWRIYPDWLPYLHILQGYYDPKGAFQNLMVKDPYTPNPPALPFPYVNSFGQIVGYQHEISRSAALFTVATRGAKR